MYISWLTWHMHSAVKAAFGYQGQGIHQPAFRLVTYTVRSCIVSLDHFDISQNTRKREGEGERRLLFGSQKLKNLTIIPITDIRLVKNHDRERTYVCSTGRNFSRYLQSWDCLHRPLFFSTPPSSPFPLFLSFFCWRQSSECSTYVGTLYSNY